MRKKWIAKLKKSNGVMVIDLKEQAELLKLISLDAVKKSAINKLLDMPYTRAEGYDGRWINEGCVRKIIEEMGGME